MIKINKLIIKLLNDIAGFNKSSGMERRFYTYKFKFHFYLFKRKLKKEEKRLIS